MAETDKGVLENVDDAAALKMRVDRAARETGNTDLLENIITAATPAVEGGRLVETGRYELENEKHPVLRQNALKKIAKGLIAQNPPRKGRP